MKTKILYVVLFCSFSFSVFSQGKIENLKVNWPEEFKWKVANNQEDEKVHFVELIPEKESLDKWTIIGTMMSLKGVKNLSMDVAVNLYYEQTKKEAPDAKLTIIEKNENSNHKWVLFKIEVEKYVDDPNPESQVYYIIQGDSSLYVNLVGIKQKTISKAFEEKWSKVFKSSELIYQ
ncbi:MAG: hypothetical protein QM535_08055 [Limnohabitans sp.]|nr:hypothetical protein [Limnohabitans sp.]